MTLVYQWTGARAACGHQAALHKARAPKMTPAERSFAQRFRTVMVDDVLSDARLDRIARGLRNAHGAAITHVIPTYDPKDPDAVAFWQAATDSFEALYRRVIETSGKQAIASLNLPMSFRLDNPYTVDTIREHTGQLITGLADQARAVVADLVEQAFVQHIPPDDLQELLRPLLSLDARSAAAVTRRLENSINGGVGEIRATRQAQEYADKLLGDRAETIARTEIIAAQDRGRQAAWADAVDQGILAPDSRKTWSAALGSERTCAICTELDGQSVALDDEFHSTILGEDLAGPPAHPRCRCATYVGPPG